MPAVFGGNLENQSTAPRGGLFMARHAPGLALFHAHVLYNFDDEHCHEQVHAIITLSWYVPWTARIKSGPVSEKKTWSIHIRRRCPDPGTPQLQYWKRWQYFTANIGSEGSRSHLRSKSVQESWGGPFGKYDIFAHKRLQRQLAHSSLPLVCLAWKLRGGGGDRLLPS